MFLIFSHRHSSNGGFSRASKPDPLLWETRYPWRQNNRSPWIVHHQVPGWPSWCCYSCSHRSVRPAPYHSHSHPETRVANPDRCVRHYLCCLARKINILFQAWCVVLNSIVPWSATTPHDDGQTRVLCVEGQFACRVFGCIDSTQLCDGRRDCLDGSDEERCGRYKHLIFTQLLLLNFFI